MVNQNLTTLAILLFVLILDKAYDEWRIRR
jgi:hypothetical protein